MQNLADDIAVNPDLSVIEKIVKGELSLFEVLVRRYNSVLYRIARSYGFNHQDAEDLMQDTHVAAYASLRKFEGRASYKTWISRIMINKCLYKLKYGHYKNEVPAEITPELKHQPVYVATKENQTERVLLNHELALVLQKSLEDLPVMYRTVFLLREVEGFSVAETAGLLEITEVNVKVRLNRAKTLLQKQVEQFYSRTEIYSFNLVYCDAIVHKVLERISQIDNQEYII
jgi:RNA polymerase sigma-70 factor (ECF subfamily)